ncbi:MAG: triose-phosphate isomerase [Clostridia bacterium]|nr:triose-phosphate isomerase [Clostridia bacterium]
MRKPIIAANWKMYKNNQEALDFVNKFKPLISRNDQVETVICAPFTLLATVGESIKDSHIALGAQNMYPSLEGAYTGEISPKMLLDLGVKYVILGHSERREILGETDQFIRQKVDLALETGLTPILCVGETLEERQQGKTQTKVSQQLWSALEGILASQAQKLVIAYEPIWAIGTGKNASPEDAEETCAFIRNCLSEIFNGEVAQNIRIQYGGSVKPGNIKEIMAQPNIDGALVGGASLDPESFAQIVNFKE